MADERTAFTLGYAPSYDENLRRATPEEPLVKVGRKAADHVGYPRYTGGWVWRTPEAADAFRTSPAFGRENPADHAVYRLELPAGWDTDVSRNPYPRDGVRRLLHDARIVERVPLTSER